MAPADAPVEPGGRIAAQEAGQVLARRHGEFKFVDAEAKLQNDGTVLVVYRFVEQALITEVQVVGNKVISDQELIGWCSSFRRGRATTF